MGEHERERRSAHVLAARLPAGGGRHPALQRRAANAALAEQQARLNAACARRTAQRAPMAVRTGLPDRLRAGTEALSGLPMDDVRVHYGSGEPAKLQAHAYTQGSDIHVAPGQERHLAHEAWHVVQQKQGRVRPTLALGGRSINDDPGLEHEADRMGARALAGLPLRGEGLTDRAPPPSTSGAQPLQRCVAADWMPDKPGAMSQGPYGNGDDGPDAAHAVQGYLAIPVGEHHEYFEDLAARADQIYVAQGQAGGCADLLAAIVANPPADAAARLQLLALRINQAYDLEAAARAAAAVHAAAHAAVAVDAPADAAAADLAPVHAAAAAHAAPQNGPAAAAVYDEAWKVAHMAAEVVVDSNAKVLSATILLPNPIPELGGKKNTRRRLMVSKGRHMWDYLGAETNEPDNSLIAAAADLSSLDADMLEMGLNFRTRFLARALGEAYEITTKSRRVFRINKTQAEYPHGYPIGGPDVTPMDKDVFNFHFGLKQSLAQISGGGDKGRGKAWALITTHGVQEKREAVLAAMTRLKLPKAACDTVRATFQTGIVAGGDPQARLLSKLKTNKPRKKRGEPKVAWNK